MILKGFSYKVMLLFIALHGMFLTQIVRHHTQEYLLMLEVVFLHLQRRNKRFLIFRMEQTTQRAHQYLDMQAQTTGMVLCQGGTQLHGLRCWKLQFDSTVASVEKQRIGLWRDLTIPALLFLFNREAVPELFVFLNPWAEMTVCTNCSFRERYLINIVVLASFLTPYIV